MNSSELTKEIERQIELIRRGSLEIIQESELRAKLTEALKNQRPLKIKMGFDPTAPDLHFGHSLGLRKLRDFQDLGHEIYFLIGDFTGRIGDPTGRSKTRPALTEQEILQNAKTYQDQVFKILDPKKTKVVFNSEWCSKLRPEQLIELTAQMNVARMLEREDFKKRYKEGQTISIHEFIYPLIQGYDSVAMKADVELGGQDQRFNLLVGRDLQKFYGQESQVVIFLPLLEGTDGIEKMSKSYGNHIGITEAPKVMFEKLLNIPDRLMEKYFDLLTRVEPATYHAWIKESPREAKFKLGHEVTKLFHSEAAAQETEEHFRKASARDYDSTEFETITLPSTTEPLAQFLSTSTKLVSSKSEARRLLEQGGVNMASSTESIKLSVDSSTADLKPGYVLKVGKKITRRIK
jgi:tyrosyl-tRNA synthetase